MKIKDLIQLRRLKKLIEKYQDKPSIQKYSMYGLLAAIGASLTVVVIGFLWVLILAITLPSVTDLEVFAASQASHIFARDESILYTIHGEEKRTSIDFEDIPNDLIDATLAIEDDQFYDHIGIDIPAIIKAVLSELTGQNNRGGSTITQQYIKNTFLSSERKYSRKMKEILMALKVEQFLSKDEIITLYFNRIPYGHNAYGVEEAAKVYFGKHAKDLTLAESVVLAALPKAPSYYSPYGENKYTKLDHLYTLEEIEKRGINDHSDLNDDEYWNGLLGNMVNLDSEGTTQIYLSGRTDLILKRMLDLGYIDETTRQMTLTELQNIEFQRLSEDLKAPHFVLWIREQVEAKYGKDLVERGGLRIYTTLDPKMQEIAETAIADRAEHNLNYNATNASLVSVNPKTGEIMAMVGSVDFHNDEIDGKVNMALSYIPPGSSFKPFVYAEGFLNYGLTAATVLYDVATDFGDGNYPQNYDGTYQGPMSIRRALGQSRNIPAIKAYFLSGEQPEILPFTQKLGMEYQEPNIEHGSSLALGPTGVKFLSLIEAYSVLANLGVHMEPYGITRIESFDGEILEEVKAVKGEQVLDPQVAYLITDILSDTSVRIGPNMTLTGRPNAAKTGTSTKRDENNTDIRLPKDTLTIGYTPSLVTGVWVGNADGSSLTGLANGYDLAAPIWKRFMQESLLDSPVESFPRPDGITEIQISTATGLLPNENTPDNMLRVEKFASFAKPSQVESADTYKVVKYDSYSKKLATEYCPAELIEEKVVRTYHSLFSEFWRWEEGVQNWAANQETDFDNEVCNLHTENSINFKPIIQINSPAAFSRIEAGDFIYIDVDIQSTFRIEKVEYYVNDVLRATSTTAPYGTQIFIRPDFKDGDEISLTAKVIDDLKFSSEAKIKLKIGQPKEVIEEENTEEQEEVPIIDRIEPGNIEEIDLGEIIE